MRRFLLLCVCVLSIQAAWTPTACAAARYVTDALEVTLRTGESNRYRMIRMLPSGTPVEVLGVNKATEYARVRTEDGTVGYLLERELQDEPAARNRVLELEQRLVELQGEPNTLAARLAALQTAYDRLDADFRTLQRDKVRLEQELATIRHASTNILEITGDRERLRIQVSELTREHADLEQANRDLGNRTNQRWFMIGAGVILLGVLIGLVLPHVTFRRRRGSWGSL
ncbi:MAG: TIGR04211 family SH3 domain-containing protein [Gammaproteobacteria bacterium]|nr:TIGR04211 family SH3 domain-containing protein [Gammaproteobacteria bacterium]